MISDFFLYIYIFIIITKYVFKHILIMTSPLPPPPSSDLTKTSWINLINESVHTDDDVDIGDIDAVSRDFIL